MSIELLAFRLDERLQDGDGVVTEAERYALLDAALALYSRHRPLVRVVDLAGDGSYDYALPSTWELSTSALQCLEFPAGNRTPTILETTAYTLYQSPTGTVLRMLEVTPAVGETLRLTYTARHTADLTSTSVPVSDQHALVDLAASLGCGWLAAHYAQEGDASISAQITEQQQKAEHYRQMARHFRDLYNLHLGLGREAQSQVVAASATADWDTNFIIESGPWAGTYDRLTHSRGSR